MFLVLFGLLLVCSSLFIVAIFRESAKTGMTAIIFTALGILVLGAGSNKQFYFEESSQIYPNKQNIEITLSRTEPDPFLGIEENNFSFKVGDSLTNKQEQTIRKISKLNEQQSENSKTDGFIVMTLTSGKNKLNKKVGLFKVIGGGNKITSIKFGKQYNVSKFFTIPLNTKEEDAIEITLAQDEAFDSLLNNNEDSNELNQCLNGNG